MSTAVEMQLRADEFRARHYNIVSLWQDVWGKQAGHLMSGREISAKRARLLRRRGDTVRYKGRTITGKARYTWIPRRIKIVANAISHMADTPSVRWFSLDTSGVIRASVKIA